MKSFCWLITLVVVIASPVRAQSGSDVPPPLVYSSFQDSETYYLFDFETSASTPIRFTGLSSIQNAGGEWNEPPWEVNAQSPYDPALQAQFINETGDYFMREGYYTLYLTDANSQREKVMDYAWPAAPLDWSPNGRYLYFYETRDQEDFALYQYDLAEPHQLTLLFQPDGQSRFQFSCHPGKEWCGFYYDPDSDYQTQEAPLLLLNTNSGEIKPIVTIFGSGQWIWWLNQTPAFIYQTPFTPQNPTLRLYDYREQTDTLIAEIKPDDRVYNVLPSPDDRWLALSTTGFPVIDRLNPEAAPILLMNATDSARVSPATLIWLSQDRLFFETNTPLDDENFEHNFYTVTFPDGNIQSAGSVIMERVQVIERAWSPDGRWLAVGLSSYGDIANALYVVDGWGKAPVRRVSVDIAPDHVLCVEWPEYTLATSGKVGACDWNYFSIG